MRKKGERMNNYRALILSFMIISCSSPDPERIKNEVLNTTCSDIEQLILTEIDDISHPEIKITDENRVCEFFTLLKEKSKKTHLEFIPTNTNIDSFVMLVYTKENELTFKIYSGIFNDENGYIILTNTKVGIVDMRFISDVEFPLKMLEIIEGEKL